MVGLTLNQMNQLIREELEHIPRGDPNSPQNQLRMAYRMARIHSLGAKAKQKQTAKDVLLAQIEFVRTKHPTFQFDFNKDFFESRDF